MSRHIKQTETRFAKSWTIGLARVSIFTAFLLFSGIFVIAASGCSNSPGSGAPLRGGQFCTNIGCGPNLNVVLPDISQAQGQVTLHYCLDGKCEERSFPSHNELPRTFALMATQERTSLSLEVRDSSRVLAQLSETQLTLKATRPNGPKCEPVCYSGEARVPAI